LVLQFAPVHADHARFGIRERSMARTPAVLPGSSLGKPGTHSDRLASN